MNFFLILLAIPVVSAAIALCIVANDHGRYIRSGARRRAVVNAKGILLRSSAFVSIALTLLFLSGRREAIGQEIVHARAGQVVEVNPSAKTLTLKVADGSTVVFRDVSDPEPAMTFDKDVRSQTVAAASFKTVGAYVVVFYFGFDSPTAVAVEGLGTTAPNRTVGSVEGFDRHKRVLTIKNGTAKNGLGQAQELDVSDKTVVETDEGVINPDRFHPNKGDSLRCFAKPGSQDAFFIATN